MPIIEVCRGSNHGVRSRWLGRSKPADKSLVLWSFGAYALPPVTPRLREPMR